MRIGNLLLTLTTLLLLLGGCNSATDELPPKAPRPVTVMTLSQSIPQSSFVVSGSVRSWKTEQIGFDIAGRIQWVLEPGRNIVGQLNDADGKMISQGTPLAKIDPDRYEVAVESAKANLAVAYLDKEVVKIRLDESIPTDIKAAESDVALAEIEYNRLKRLKSQNAIAAADFDTVDNRLKTERARLQNLKASLKQTKAELKAAEARVMSAEQLLRDAMRDLDNTTLYASYRGQISDVQVVPGSVVNAGSPVLTLQMMDPIKVEVEVSAEQSRELQQRRQVPVTFTAPDGTTVEQNAYVYMVDPSANPSTRTFSATLLIMNRQYRPELPEHLRAVPMARTEDCWPMNMKQIVGSNEGQYQIEEGSIDSDEQGSFVWRVTNATLGERLPRLLKVEKLRIQPLDIRISFLGNWVFRPAIFPPSESGPAIGEQALIAGKLEFPDGDRSKWDGESVFLDSGDQWTLRPGDLVNVNLGGETKESGYFVPVECIYEESGKTYIFVVDGERARQLEVTTIIPDELDNGSAIQILPKNSGDFRDGIKIVVGGVHFLKDGDRIAETGSFSISDSASTTAESLP